MKLNDVIARLEAETDPDRVVPAGFGEPDSYRGFYEQLAFEPASYVTVGSMLEHARSAVGTVFQGYKGGDYVMDGYTDVWVAPYGETVPESLHSSELERMLAPPRDAARLARDIAIELYRGGLISEITADVTGAVERAVTAVPA